jgi:hypothetical protein
MTLTALLASLAAASPIPPPVVGGEPVEAGARLDVAAIYFGLQVGCTGVLVAPQVVLTAGHCASGVTQVKVGTNDYTQGGEQIRVVEIIEHEDSWNTYDVAVLLLETPSTQPPAPLALDCALDDYLFDGAAVAIVGYGATDVWGTVYGSALMEAHTEVHDHDCSDIPSGCNAQVSPDGEVAAGGDGVDACYGDSGGPLYLLTPEGDYLVGLTSRAYSGVAVPCEYGGIYVRPDAVVDWIEEVGGVTLPRPDCGGNQAPQPVVAPLVVEAGETAAVDIDPNDPDDGDSHTIVIAEPPTAGDAYTDGGVVYYVAGETPGADRFTLEVSDDGDPPRSIYALVDVEIRAASSVGAPTPDDPGGCRRGTSDAGFVVFAPLLLLGRRRRR